MFHLFASLRCSFGGGFSRVFGGVSGVPGGVFDVFTGLLGVLSGGLRKRLGRDGKNQGASHGCNK
jgi:hypothetical protein